MKLSYKKYPALVFADKKKLMPHLGRIKSQFDAAFAKLDPKSEDYSLAWVEHQMMCCGYMTDKPIYFLSEAFQNAVEKNESKLADLLNDNPDIINDTFENCIIVTKQGDIHTMHILDKNRQFYCRQNSNGAIVHCCIFDKSTFDTKVYFTVDAATALKSLHAMQKVITFKKYASVDLEIIKPGEKKKVKDAEAGKVLNEMGIEAIMLDSTWFREIIRNEGFKVRGHFRLQPCKNEKGEWTRKIIYIEEFEKHGYHRRAKIAVEQETIEQALS